MSSLMGYYCSSTTSFILVSPGACGLKTVFIEWNAHGGHWHEPLKFPFTKEGLIPQLLGMPLGGSPQLLTPLETDCLDGKEPLHSITDPGVQRYSPVTPTWGHSEGLSQFQKSPIEQLTFHKAVPKFNLSFCPISTPRGLPNKSHAS